MNTQLPKLSNLALSTATLLSVAVPQAALAQGEAESRSARLSDVIEEIVITARRREETLQEVPVSMDAFSTVRIQEATVLDLGDLTNLSPGIRFSFEGSKTSTSVSMRGLGKVPLGVGVPAVVVYMNDVSMPEEGTNMPTYDLENIQVLKGPQGTLFGRNTLAGAVLMTTQKPTHEFEGYVKGGVGNYELTDMEGAINIPLVPDMLSARLAFQKRERDGTTKNMNDGPDFDDINQESVRLSVLFEPTDNLSNILVVDYNEAFEQPAAVRIRNTNLSSLGPLAPLWGPPIEAFYKAQLDLGPHRAFSNLTDPGANRRTVGFTNTTEIELSDNLLVKNIFGYRDIYLNTQINTAGTGPLIVPVPGVPGLESELVLFIASSQMNRTYLSNEIQLQGTSFGDRLDWIVGGLYAEEEPDGPSGSEFQIFDLLIDGSNQRYAGTYVENKHYAVFGQIELDISEWTVSGLSFELGARYSKDKVDACAGGLPSRYPTQRECDTVAALGLLDGTGTVDTDGSEPTYNIGLNWQVSDDLFVYLTHRSAFRAGNVNLPAFETAFTTGGSGCSLAGSPVTCPDLRPFQTVGKETLKDFEVGFKSDWDLSNGVLARLNASYFYSIYEDGVQFFNAVNEAGIPPAAPDSPARSSIAVNTADFTIQGLEFIASLSPIEGLTFSATGAFIDQTIDELAMGPFGVARSKDEVTLPTPEFSGTLAMRWELPYRPLDGDLILNVDYFYTDKWDGQLGIPLPSYELTNTRLDLRNIGNTGFDLGLWIRNAFDEEYETAPLTLSSQFPVATTYWGAPRTWGLDLRYSW